MAFALLCCFFLPFTVYVCLCTIKGLQNCKKGLFFLILLKMLLDVSSPNVCHGLKYHYNGVDTVKLN